MDAQNWVYDLNNKCKIEGVGDERPFLQCVKNMHFGRGLSPKLCTG